MWLLFLCLLLVFFWKLLVCCSLVVEGKCHFYLGFSWTPQNWTWNSPLILSCLETSTSLGKRRKQWQQEPQWKPLCCSCPLLFMESPGKEEQPGRWGSCGGSPRASVQVAAWAGSANRRDNTEFLFHSNQVCPSPSSVSCLCYCDSSWPTGAVYAGRF